MEMILPIFMVIAAASACLGWWLGKFLPRTATIFAGINCAVLVLGGTWFHQVHWWPEWMITRSMVWASTFWYLPFALVLFFIAVSQSRERSWRENMVVPDPRWINTVPGKKPVKAAPWYSFGVVMYFLCVTLILFALHEIYGHLHTGDWWDDLPPGQRSPEFVFKAQEKDGILFQRTSFTCGPTSVANLMRITGVDPKATDGELIQLCMMKYNGAGKGGSSVLEMALGLKAKAAPAGYHTQILCPDLEELKTLHKPMVCSVMWGPSIHHAVVVAATDPEKGVLILDPLVGYYWENWRNFEKSYLNSVILMYKNDPKEPSQPVAPELLKL